MTKKDKRWAAFSVKYDEDSREPLDLNGQPHTTLIVPFLTAKEASVFKKVTIPPPLGGWKAGVTYRVVISGESIKAVKVEGEFGDILVGEKPLSEKEEQKLYETHPLDEK